MPCHLLAVAVLLSTGAAHAAGTVVLHEPDQDPSIAVSEVAPFAGVNPDEITATTLVELRGDGTLTTWPSKLERCEGEPTSISTVEEAVKRAEGHLSYDRTEDATRMLALAKETLGCLDATIESEIASRIFFLSGVLAMEAEEPLEAQMAFHQAIVMNDSLDWDDSFAPTVGQDLFNSAKASLGLLAKATLVAAPYNVAYAVSVDGKALTPESPSRAITPGRHLVQAGSPTVSSYWVNFGPGKTVYVLFRGDFPESAITWAAQPDRSMELSALLANELGVGTPVYVLSTQSGLFKGTAGSDNFEAAQPAIKTGTKEASQANGKSKRSENKASQVLGTSRTSLWAPQLLKWSGAGVTALASAWALQMQLTGQDLFLECFSWNEEHHPQKCQKNRAEYNQLRNRLPIVDGVAIAGAAMLGAGFYWGQAVEGVVSPWVNGRGIALTVQK